MIPNTIVQPKDVSQERDYTSHVNHEERVSIYQIPLTSHFCENLKMYFFLSVWNVKIYGEVVALKLDIWYERLLQRTSHRFRRFYIISKQYHSNVKWFFFEVKFTKTISRKICQKREEKCLDCLGTLYIKNGNKRSI